MPSERFRMRMHSFDAFLGGKVVYLAYNAWKKRYAITCIFVSARVITKYFSHFGLKMVLAFEKLNLVPVISWNNPFHPLRIHLSRAESLLCLRHITESRTNASYVVL